MFSVPSYPRSDKYYSHKGQIIRRRRMDTPAPLSPQQLQQAYDYFVARSILFPPTSPTPPLDTNIYLFYSPHNSETISRKEVLDASVFITPSNTDTITISRYELSIFAFIYNSYPNRIYFFAVYGDSLCYVQVNPNVSYNFISNSSAGNANWGLRSRGGFTSLGSLYYLPIARPSGSQTYTLNSDILSSLVYYSLESS